MAVLGKNVRKTESREDAREMVKKSWGKPTFVTAVKVLYLHGLTVKMWDAVTKTKVSMRKMTTPNWISISVDMIFPVLQQPTPSTKHRGILSRK